MDFVTAQGLETLLVVSSSIARELMTMIELTQLGRQCPETVHGCLAAMNFSYNRSRTKGREVFQRSELCKRDLKPRRRLDLNSI